MGDFDQWDPAAHPLQARRDGMRAATVVLPASGGHSFRYLAGEDYWFDDDQADGHDDTESRITI
ncbi:hypothetical protein ACFY9C_00170 [Streptomyces filamentosus]|uniref:hypothetical protein n=1 Tax=Streptomyces filamentosus TaxID=67294 RepID=UPI0036ED00C1